MVLYSLANVSESCQKFKGRPSLAFAFARQSSEVHSGNLSLPAAFLPTAPARRKPKGLALLFGDAVEISLPSQEEFSTHQRGRGTEDIIEVVFG